MRRSRPSSPARPNPRAVREARRTLRAVRVLFAWIAIALVVCGCGQSPTSIGGGKPSGGSKGQEVNLDPSQLGRERSAAKARLSQGNGAHPQVVVAVRPGDVAVPDVAPSSAG